MSRSVIWVSIRTIKMHEFRRMLRAIRGKDHNWLTEYARLTEIQQDSVKKASKAFATPLFFYAILASFGSPESVSFAIKNVTISAPTGMVTLIASASFLFVFMYLQSALMIVLVRSSESAKLTFSGFSAGTIGMLHKIDDLDIAVPVLPWGSLRAIHPFSWFLGNSIFFIILCLLFPIIAIEGYLLQIQIDILKTPANGWLNYLGALIGICAIGISISYLILFNIPLPYKKNLLYIRWGFLWLISKQFPHPREEFWH